MKEQKTLTLAQLVLREQFEQTHQPLQPNFSLTKNLEVQDGFFWFEKDVTPKIGRFFISVGQVQCGDQGIGTAFALKTKNGTYFLSALHLLQQEGLYDRFSLNCGDLKIPLSRKKIKKVKDKDIVVIKASENMQVQALEISDKEALAGKTVMTIGFPSEYLRYRYIYNPVLSIGKLLEFNENKFRANLRSEHGSSGSPLLDREGKVIGILLESLTTNNDTVTYLRSRGNYRGQVMSQGILLRDVLNYL